ncbi:ABC transporter permease [Streptomyces sp. NPDC005931]|uniref:ABC transporter permease n=1 Tax=Streptomyces sp. NPDC005931 TaxID=3364737 RepID=UPI0036A0C365
MTTTTPLETAAPSAGPAAHGTAPAAVLTLARFEARRLLLSVPVLLAFAVYAGWTAWRTTDSWDGFPALQDADRATQTGPLLVGLAVLLAANHAVLRSHRHDTERHFAVLVVSRWQRTVAHLLSVVPAALLAAVGVVGQFTWEALKPGAVGHGSPAELLVGPLSVLLMGAGGVLLARLVSSSLAAPLLVVFFLLYFFVVAAAGDAWSRWLVMVVHEPSSQTLPSELVGRPAAWHAVYLAGLALVLGLLAVLLSGGARLRTVRAGLALAVAVTGLGAVYQAGGVPPETTEARTRLSVTPEKEHACVRRDGSTYCAFPEWGPRVDDWAAAVERVRSLAGGAAGDRALTVRQRVEARYGLSGDAAIAPLTRPDEVTVGTSWGGNRVPEFSVAVAGVLVAGTEEAASTMCDGRMVTVMWLALGASPDPMSDLRRVRIDDSVSGGAVVISRTEPVYLNAAHTELVRELLAQPREAVAAKVRAHWDELTAPRLTTDRAAQLLGLAAPEEADECL